MSAEIISIGSELTTGRNLDTNSQWLSLRLAEIGIPVRFHTTVADNLADNVDAFKTAARRAAIVLSSGGLGPTQDDLTREALAAAAGVSLVQHEASLQAIREMFARRQRPMPPRNEVQALLPEGAEPIPNTCGTAPGVWMSLGGSVIAAMPGVPSEMRVMFHEWVRPRLIERGTGGQVLVERKINCFGAGESVIEQKLLDLTRRDFRPEVGITVSDGIISLRIFATGATADEALTQAAPIEAIIRERLGEWVYGRGDEELQDVVLRLLGERHRTLATAESVTAGLVAHRLATVPGCSRWFRGGVVAYTNELKQSLLGVPAGLIEEKGSVSAEVAESMAIGCRVRFGTDLAISTTGYAGPESDPDKPVGLVYAAVAWNGGVRSASWNWTGTRTEVQSRTAKLALNLARLQLLR